MEEKMKYSPEDIKTKKLYLDMGLTQEEYDIISKKLLNRLPNYTEIGLYSGMWSEHCSYKNSKPVLKKFWTDGSRVIQGPGEGAGVLDIGDDQAIVFKAESHNHPSFVEPYEGAATGVGGIIRDIFSMGAKPIASLDSLRFGSLTNTKNKYLLNKVVAGIAGYGNCIGIPTVGGEIEFDDSYNGNPLVNVMCIGLMNQADIKQGKATGNNNSIIYVGAKTGRDGINGASFASSQFSENEDNDRSAVQVGDPFMEKLLVDACLEINRDFSDDLVGIQDMGAAGLVSSSAEMAAKDNSGIKINLDLVPQRELGMSPYEIMLSESQERMLLCVKDGAEQNILDVFKKYNLEAVIIGKVNENSQYCLTMNDQVVCDIPTRSLVDDVPTYTHELVKPERLINPDTSFDFEVENPYETLNNLLSQPTISSKKSVYQQYDSRVQTNTVVDSGSDAAVVRIRGTKKALAMTTDCNSNYVYLDPYQGGQIAVAEAARNIIASGGTPIGITNCLNFGNPDNSESYFELEESVKGISDVCQKIDAPVIGGNVSLYNETDDHSIKPTPMIGMVGLIEDNKNIITQDAKGSDELVYLIGDTFDDYSGSEIQKMLVNKITGELNHFDVNQEINNQELVKDVIKKSLVKSVHDLSEGGLGVALTELLQKNELGFKGQVDLTKKQLFSETQSRFLISIDSAKQSEFEAIMKNSANLIGKTNDIELVDLELSDGKLLGNMMDLKKSWEEGLTCLMK
ncbi:phosphoribosylformylglycinamidine synthase subunit PurL [Lactobacillus sp. S2-2]|nr:phosphoribosylformylglycinamidine synthase subunit PurL [Lactobacillus sp. S2-2]